MAALLAGGEYRGDAIPFAPDLDAPPRVVEAGEPAVLYLNFDGATLVAGSEDARGNVTTIGTLEGEFPEYGDSDGTKREAVIQAVREDWGSYNVIITDERPDGGEYVMCMIGPSDAYPSNTLGIAPLDCDDAGTRNNITFAFHGVDDGHTAAQTATTISQEIAHSFGLDDPKLDESVPNELELSNVVSVPKVVDGSIVVDGFTVVDGAELLLSSSSVSPVDVSGSVVEASPSVPPRPSVKSLLPQPSPASEANASAESQDLMVWQVWQVPPGQERVV